MNAIQKKQLAFLNETIAFYNSSNRCVLDNICRYAPLTAQTPGCAIGRTLKPKLKKELDLLSDNGESFLTVFKLLPNRLKILGKDFLGKVQNLHDSKRNWDENGLSEFGQREATYIKSLFELE